MKIGTYHFRKMLPAALFTVAVLFMEILLKLITCRSFFNIGLLFMPLFTLAAGLLMQAITTLFRPEKTKWIQGGTLIFFFLLYGTQAVYHRFFNKFLIAYSLAFGGVGQVLSGNMARNVTGAILKSLLFLLLLAVPVILYFVFYDRVADVSRRRDRWYRSLLSALILHVALVLVIGWLPSTASVQSGSFDPNDAVGRFGLLRTEVLDLKYNLFGLPQQLTLEEEPVSGEVTPSGQESAYQVSAIDFAALATGETDETLKAMNAYFAEKEPTAKNAYTGMYKGYNLVTVVAEGFSPYAIDPELTPTLYKMQQEGFKFTNFYTPIWGVSTSDGEYTACTGLIPKAGTWSFYQSGNNYMPYCLGNMFQSIGVKNTFAYHNNSYSYYRRDISHPNMGYRYKGLGNGVEAYVDNVWPQSDEQMVAGSLKDYVTADEPFHVYYMTVSGHLEYSYENNAMSQKHWDAVKDLDCSDTLKAYYACNMELDHAMKTLLAALNEAGVADKTVIALTPDHYPYGLEQDIGERYAMWTELLGHEVETEFELYKSCFLLYCQGTKETPTVDKLCYSADILPTLLNLFGFEYDSRLLVGRDILSDSNGMVVMSNRSFITECGHYNATTDEFIPTVVFESEEAIEEYVTQMQASVNNTFKIAAKILETDYYRYVFEE